MIAFAFVISTLFVYALSTFGIPICVAAVTKAKAPSWVKYVANACFSAATAILNVATTQDGTAVISGASLGVGLVTFLSAIGAYVGVYRPQALNSKIAPDKGIG